MNRNRPPGAMSRRIFDSRSFQFFVILAAFSVLCMPPRGKRSRRLDFGQASLEQHVQFCDARTSVPASAAPASAQGTQPVRIQFTPECHHGLNEIASHLGFVPGAAGDGSCRGAPPSAVKNMLQSLGQNRTLFFERLGVTQVLASCRAFLFPDAVDVVAPRDRIMDRLTSDLQVSMDRARLAMVDLSVQERFCAGQTVLNDDGHPIPLQEALAAQDREAGDSDPDDPRYSEEVFRNFVYQPPTQRDIAKRRRHGDSVLGSLLQGACLIMGYPFTPTTANVSLQALAGKRRRWGCDQLQPDAGQPHPSDEADEQEDQDEEEGGPSLAKAPRLTSDVFRSSPSKFRSGQNGSKYRAAKALKRSLANLTIANWKSEHYPKNTALSFAALSLRHSIPQRVVDVLRCGALSLPPIFAPPPSTARPPFASTLPPLAPAPSFSTLAWTGLHAIPTSVFQAACLCFLNSRRPPPAPLQEHPSRLFHAWAQHHRPSQQATLSPGRSGPQNPTHLQWLGSRLLWLSLPSDSHHLPEGS